MEEDSLTISLLTIIYSSGSRKPAGWLWKYLYTKSSTRLASFYVGEPELIKEVFFDFRSGSINDEVGKGASLLKGEDTGV
jgi:hypothetical protein